MAVLNSKCFKCVCVCLCACAHSFTAILAGNLEKVVIVRTLPCGNNLWLPPQLEGSASLRVGLE